MDRRQQRAGRLGPPRLIQRIAVDAGGHDQQGWILRYGGRQLGEVSERRLIGPMQVFDDQQTRLLPARPLEYGEHPVLPRLRVVPSIAS